jgi:hypothetical protein
MCVCHYIFFVFIKDMFAVNKCTTLKSTFSIREIIGFKGMPLWSGIFLGSVISLVTMGDIRY